jgi:hypothetical protein
MQSVSLNTVAAFLILFAFAGLSLFAAGLAIIKIVGFICDKLGGCE